MEISSFVGREQITRSTNCTERNEDRKETHRGTKGREEWPVGGGKGLEGGPARDLPPEGRELAGQVLKRARTGHRTSL